MKSPVIDRLTGPEAISSAIRRGSAAWLPKHHHQSRIALTRCQAYDYHAKPATCQLPGCPQEVTSEARAVFKREN